MKAIFSEGLTVHWKSNGQYSVTDNATGCLLSETDWNGLLGPHMYAELEIDFQQVKTTLVSDIVAFERLMELTETRKEATGDRGGED